MIALLPAIFLIGVITSYQDFKFGKIKNKWILLGLFYSLVVYCLFASFYILYGQLNSSYLFNLMINLFFAVLTGFLFWCMKLWASGDGKLFIVYSALVPLSAYSLSPQKWFPSVDLLINIFILAFVFIFFNMLFKVRLKTLKKISFASLKKSFEVNQLFFGAINLFVFFWIVELFLSLVNLDNNLLKIGLPMILFLFLPKKFEGKTKYFFLVLVFLRLILDQSVYSLDFFKNFLFLFLVVFLIRGFLETGVNNLGQEVFSQEIKINQLKSGMILSKIIVKKDKGELASLKSENVEVVYYKKNYYAQQPKSLLNLGDFIGEEPEGLTKEQIKLIKEMGFKRVSVSKTISFAILMFGGVLLTLFFKGNFLSFLMGVF